MGKNRQIMTPSEASSKYDSNTQSLKTFVQGMNLKKSRDIFIDWIKSRGEYLFSEDEYKKTLSKEWNKLQGKEKVLMRTFTTREVVRIDFGYNIGAEYGGEHYAVVMKKSGPKDQRLYVIPLRSDRDFIESKEEGFKLRTPHPTEFNLGILPFLNSQFPEEKRKGSLAKVVEATPVSKLRIVSLPVGKLEPELFEKLKNQWLSVFFATEQEEVKKLKREVERLKNEIQILKDA